MNEFKEDNAWNTIAENVKDIHGWSPIEQLYSLYMLGILTQNLDGDIVEIGAWGGRSTIALGLAAKESGNSVVHSIDYFPCANDWKENDDGTFSFNVEINGNYISGLQNQTVWKEPFLNSILPFYKEHPDLLVYFNSNIKNCGLEKVVKPCQGDSFSFINGVPDNFKCRLIYIDAEHSEEAVYSDISNLKKFLVKDGAICFDDAFTSYDGVDKAIERLIINSGEFHSCTKLTRKLFVAFKN